MRKNMEMQAMGDHGEAIGLDFGTTNSPVALLDGDSRVRLASSPSGGVDVASFRSVLYSEQLKLHGAPKHIRFQK
jgi:molecular chaperone DnaK (HSP70)